MKTVSTKTRLIPQTNNMSEQTQQLVSVAKLVGLSGAAGLSGKLNLLYPPINRGSLTDVGIPAYIASFSVIGIPAVQMAPVDLMAKQWSRIYHIGKDTAPPFAITISSAFAFLAYHCEYRVSRDLPILQSTDFLHRSACPGQISSSTCGSVWRCGGSPTLYRGIHTHGDVEWRAGVGGQSCWEGGCAERCGGQVISGDMEYAELCAVDDCG